MDVRVGKGRDVGRCRTRLMSVGGHLGSLGTGGRELVHRSTALGDRVRECGGMCSDLVTISNGGGRAVLLVRCTRRVLS